MPLKRDRGRHKRGGNGHEETREGTTRERQETREGTKQERDETRGGERDGHEAAPQRRLPACPTMGHWLVTKVNTLGDWWEMGLRRSRSTLSCVSHHGSLAGEKGQHHEG